MSDIIRRPSAELVLPGLPDQMLPAVDALVQALGIPRDVLASDEEIVCAWRELPREIGGIPPEIRGELVARMCVAVSAGLFDGAINYAWNATVLHLRQRMRDFRLPVIAQILQRDFEEKDLLELRDSELLEICLKLNLITEDGFFFLDQCRDTRNNFSAAHPTIGKINDREFTAFLNRCVRYALSNDTSPRGVDISAFIGAVSGPRFAEGQCDVWTERLAATHDGQRELLIGTTHGIYCDPGSPEPARLNALDLCLALRPQFNAGVRSLLIDRHSDYLAKGDTNRYSASQQFFEKLGLLSLLSESERHALVSSATRRLWAIHQDMNNFYNEPPFAERLRQISEQGPVPKTAQEEYVRVVVSCYVGNGYGVSWDAEPHYEAMIKSFSPHEVAYMFALGGRESSFGKTIRSNGNMMKRYVLAAKLLDASSVPSAVRVLYTHLIKSS